MKTRNETLSRIKIAPLITCLFLGLVISTDYSEAASLPKVNLSAVNTHQKELVGKRRMIGALVKGGQQKKISQSISQLVLEETQNSLPEEFKKNSRTIAQTIIEEANKFSMDPLFLLAVIKHESHFNPTIVGTFKEIGLMQIKPDTALWIGKKIHMSSPNLYDPATNIKIGAAFFGLLRNKFEKDSRLYISAYNMGAANTRKLLKNNKRPKEYASKVMKIYMDLVDTLELSLMNEPFPKVANN